MTVTGTTRFSASQTWVMPSLRPRMPLPAMVVVFLLLVRGGGAHANAPPALAVPAERVFGCATRFPRGAYVDVGWRNSVGGGGSPTAGRSTSQPILAEGLVR